MGIINFGSTISSISSFLVAQHRDSRTYPQLIAIGWHHIVVVEIVASPATDEAVEPVMILRHEVYELRENTLNTHGCWRRREGWGA